MVEAILPLKNSESIAVKEATVYIYGRHLFTYITVQSNACINNKYTVTKTSKHTENSGKMCVAPILLYHIITV